MLSLRPVRILVACACALVVGHLIGLYVRQRWDVDPELGMVRQFDLNGEGNLAAFYASFVLGCCALVALAIGIVKRLEGEHLGARWTAFAGFLLLMAVDESAQLHDMATGPLRNSLHVDFGALYFAWLMPALLILGAAIYYFRPLLGSLSPGVRPQLLIGAMIFLGGAVGFEMIGGSAVESGRQSLSYLSVMTVEEILEMIGGLVVLTALLRQLRTMRPRVVASWVGQAPEVELPGEHVPASDQRH